MSDVRNITVRLSLKDTDAVTAGLQKMGADGEGALRRITAATDPAARSLTSLEDKWDRLGAAERRHTADLDKARQAFVSLNTPLAEQSRLLGLATQAHERNIARLGQVGASAGSAAAEHRNLAMGFAEVEHVGRSLFDSLAAGQNPIRALSMEVPRLAQSWSFLNEATRTSVLTFARTAAPFAATAVAVGAAAYAIADYDDQQRLLARSIEVGAHAAGYTTSGLNDLARQTSATSDVSVREARKIEAAYASTGAIGGDVLAGLTKSTRGYADLLGEELPEATKELASMFADPSKGAETLQARIHSLSASQLDQIRTMDASGDRLGAQRLMLEAVADAATKGATQVDVLSKIWREVTLGPADRLDEIQSFLRDAVTDNPDSRRRRAEALASIGGARSKDEVATLSDQQKRKNDEEAKRANQQQVDALQNSATEEVRRVTPLAEERFNLTSERDHLRRASVGGGPLAQGESDAADRLDRMLQDLMTPLVRARQTLADQTSVDELPVADREEMSARIRAEREGRARGDTPSEIGQEREVAAQTVRQRNSTTAGDEGDSARFEGDQALRVAQAYSQSSAAGLVAEANRSAEASRRINNQVDVVGRAGDLISEATGRLAEESSKTLPALGLARTSAERVASASAAGPGAAERARLQGEIAERTKADQDVLATPGSSAAARAQAQANIQRVTDEMTASFNAGRTGQASLGSQEAGLRQRGDQGIAAGYLASPGAGIEAEARARAAEEANTNPAIDVTRRTREIIEQGAASTAAGGARESDDITFQAGLARSVADASANGPAAAYDARLQAEIAARTRPLSLARDASTDPTTRAALSADIDRTGSAVTQGTDAARDDAANRRVAALQQATDLEREELGIIGDTNDARAQEMARLEARNRLIQEGYKGDELDSRALTEGNAAASLAAAGSERQHRQQTLGDLQQASDSIIGTGENSLTKLEQQPWNARRIAGQGLEDAGNALQNAVLWNPLKEYANQQLGGMFGDGGVFGGAGKLLQGSGGAGGWLGDLFGGGIDAGTASAGESDAFVDLAEGFAGGGIMTSRGRVPIRAYSGGGIARSPQLAYFAENGTPEAYVPVPSGRIPVEVRGGMGGGGNNAVFNQSNNITIGGGDNSGAGVDQAAMSNFARQLPGLIRQHTQDVLVTESQPGGMLWHAMRNGTVPN